MYKAPLERQKTSMKNREPHKASSNNITLTTLLLADVYLILPKTRII